MFRPIVVNSPQQQKNKMFEIARSIICGGQQQSFFMYEPDILKNAIKTWNLKLPKVTPYYAIKANDHPLVLETLGEIDNVRIDCASKNEMLTALTTLGSLENCIYSHPCKDVDHLLFARDNNLPMTVVDSVEEMEKLKRYCPNVNILCRIAVSNEYSRVLLGNKFGCSENKAGDIIKAARSLNLNLCGVSFHVGSACGNAEGFVHALQKAHETCRRISDSGLNAKIINLGGGFTADLFEEVSSNMNEHLLPDMTYIAEPGRLFVERSFGLFLKITSKRHLIDEVIEYTVNDGVYGALNNIIYDKFPASLYPFCDSDGVLHQAFENEEIGRMKPSRFWGPSCDGLDLVTPEPIAFIEMEEGGWVYVPNAGAYINPGAEFNGFPVADVYKV